MNTDIHTAERDLTDRMDSMPLTRKHRRILGASGIGWAFDAMDVGLITYVIAVLTDQWGLSGTEKSWIVSAGFIGMAIGAAAGGRLADRFGRRTIFTATLIIYGIATGLSALVSAVIPLVILRVFVGLGLGAELPVASTLVAELSPRKVRGSVVVWLEAFWAIGWMIAAVIGYYVVPASHDGWRWAFAVGALPALYAVYLRSSIPESVRYLLRRGRRLEAEAVVESFEADIRKGQKQTSRVPVAEPDVTSAARSIYSPELRKRTIALWAIWFMVNFAYYGAFIWIPSILVSEGHSLVQSFGFTLIMALAQLPGYATAAILIERWGRRPTLALFLLGSAGSAVAFGLASTHTTIIIAGCLLSFFNLGAWGALYAITPELYPTSLRGRGSGAATGFGRLASIVAPFAVTALLAATSKGILFAVFASAFAIAALALIWIPEFKGASLQR
ncbi:MFS transporter [Actinomycetaceae bacterium WB03_NA08]|uniref:MFS transporter n=1 Tax=Scrofimicrobium canadense TaxID=2652290 RepID=A0A6N7W2A7_9ACTO|nr:MFS transporter [Scrofimicrobium canadense]MSS83541.1 MFS transporter [Scrofimicrobium canadense]